jgi:hypothetical protein
MKKILVLVAMLVTGQLSYAADAGCGLGTLAISRNTKLMQLFALTTNSSTFTQVLGITSGTSGCSASGLVQNDKQMQYFVEINHQDIQREMAEGKGEKLQALALLNGCFTDESQSAFAQFSQQNFGKIVTSSSQSASDLVHNMKTEFNGNENLVNLCHGS